MVKFYFVVNKKYEIRMMITVEMNVLCNLRVVI